MKKKILSIIIIATIVVVASVLVALSFFYPEETTEIPISGTLSPDKAEYHDLGYLKHNSAVGLSLDIDGDCEEGVSIEVVNVNNNRSVAGLYHILWHAEGCFDPLFFGDHFTLRIEAKGDGDYPLSYNGTIYITQRGLW